jgi:hypothetical protein
VAICAYFNLLGLATICLLSAVAPGAPESIRRESPDKWWANVTDSPLRLTVSTGERFLYLSNSTSKKIRAYKLGCVLDKEGRWTVLSEFDERAVDLEPHQSLLNGVGVYDSERSTCGEKGAKLAVVTVTFSDGTKWKADGVRVEMCDENSNGAERDSRNSW